MLQCNTENEAKRNETSVQNAEKHDASAGQTAIERQEITAAGKELVQYIQDLYNSGAKLWTKEMFHDVEAELAKEPKPHAIMIRSSKQILKHAVTISILCKVNSRCYSEWGTQTQADPRFF
jgi:hypothetical protein